MLPQNKVNSPYKVGVATYEEVIEALRCPEKLIIDVREPAEIQASGQIPKSINIPCKWDILYLNYDITFNLLIFFMLQKLVEKIYSELRLSAPAFGAKYERSKPGCYDELIFYCKFGDLAQVAAETAINIGFRK